MHKKHTNFIFFLSILIVLVSLVTLVFFFKAIENKNKHASAVLATLSDKMIKKENIDALTKKMAEIEATRMAIESYFVDPSAIDSFVNYLESLGKEGGSTVKVENLVASAEDSTVLTVTITANGTFSGTMRTLMLLENAPYKIHVMRAHFSQEGETVASDPEAPKTEIRTPTWKLDATFTVLLSS